MTDVGTGVVKIEPDFSGFDAEMRAHLAKYDAAFKRVGKNAGESFGTGFARGGRDIDKARASLSGVDRESRKATKGFEGLAASYGGNNNGLRRMARGLDDFGGASAGATATIGGLRVALAALIPLTVGFGGATVSVVSALGPLVGLAAAAGNALAAAAQGFGAFKLATMGVVDALKEQIDNQDKVATTAASNAGAQRSAARAIQSAQDGVRSAVQALSDAQREQAKAINALGPAYSAARMRLTDLRAAVADSTLSLQGARLAAVDARQALADLLRGPDPRELADAHRAVTDAVSGERNAVLGLRSAYKELADLLKPPDVLDVADATDAVADAVRNEERARLALNEQIAKTNFILQAGPGLTEEGRAKARLDLADAESAVGDASRQAEHARQALAKLESGPDQDAIAAARQRVSDAENQVKRSAQDTVAARQDLTKIETPATAHAIAQARLDVAQAENAVTGAERDHLRAARELDVAQRQGIERSDEVVAARDTIAKANRAVADSGRDVSRAEQAVSDAQLSAKESAVATAAATANLSEKMDDLPPAAQAFVRELVAMKPRLDELRQTAAAGFFPGATRGLRAAMGSFDEVNHVLRETSGVLGEATRKSGELVGSPAFGRDIVRIGHSNSIVLDTLGEAARHVVSALRHVAIAAGPLTQWLARLVNGWALNAAEAAKSGRETGKLAAFFDRTRAVTERFFSILGHLTSGLIGLGHAGSVSGNQILASIDRAAIRFDQWTHSVRGQHELQDFFRQTHEIAAALVPVLSGITGAIGALVLKTLPLTAILTTLGPLADEATTAFIAYKLAAIGAAAATRTLNTVMAISAFITGGWTSAFWALNAVLVANPIGVVVLALGALIAALALAWHNSQTFRDILTGVWNAIKTVVTAATSAIVSTVTAGWNTIRSATSATWSTISGGLSSAWGGIRSAASSAWNAIRDAILTPIRAVRDLIGDVVAGIANRLQSGWNAITKGVGKFAGDLKDAVVDGIKGGLNQVIAFLNDIIDVVNKLPFVDIGHIGKIGAEKRAADTAGPGKKPGGFARGGAYARTGGIVDRPMVLMGEEAPCIARGTLIETSTGPKAIERVRVGERVLTRNGYRPVVWSGVTRRNAEVVRVATVDGDSVLCTPDHRIWTMSGGRDGNGGRDCLGGGTLRGGGLLSYYESARQESVRDAGPADDGSRCRTTVPGHCGSGQCPYTAPSGRAQDDLLHGCSESSGCRAHHQGLHAVAMRATEGQGPGAASAYRDIERGSRAPGGVLQAWPPVGAGEHLRQPTWNPRLLTVQAGGQPGMVAHEVRHRSRVCPAQSGGIARVREAEACRSRFRASAERATPQGACWRQASNLVTGDWVWALSDDGRLRSSQVASITPAAERIDTYDLCVAIDHEFMAGAILVHNSHPEFVIPTNPAYRDRARDLLRQAWGEIGFATGGVYSKRDLAALWRRVNGDLGDANLMAAIGLAESGGQASIVNQIGAGGLWQIYPPEPGYLDPETNARIAGRKLRTQGLGAWEAYTNGAYRKFMGAGASSGGGVLGAITGVLGDLLSKGASFLLDQLPGTGNLPTWLRDTGKAILDKAGDWIRDKVSDAIGLGGGSGAAAGGVTDAIQGAMALARKMGLQITSTTGGQHAQNSWHYKGRAADVAGSASEMAAFYRAALGRYDGRLLELFYDPLGAIKNGHEIPAIGGHSDHVHIALAQGGVLPPYGGSFATGGIVPGPIGSPRLIEAHAGEAVLPADDMRDLAHQLRVLNASPTTDVIRALVGAVNTSQGRSARHRSLTAGMGGFPATP